MQHVSLYLLDYIRVFCNFKWGKGDTITNTCHKRAPNTTPNHHHPRTSTRHSACIRSARTRKPFPAADFECLPTLNRLDIAPFPGACLRQQPQAVFHADGALPFVWRLFQVSHLVLQVPAHRKPVQGLVSTAAYTGVVHVGRDHYPNAVFASSVTDKTTSH
jgi:hypothetical protein